MEGVEAGRCYLTVPDPCKNKANAGVTCGILDDFVVNVMLGPMGAKSWTSAGRRRSGPSEQDI